MGLYTYNYMYLISPKFAKYNNQPQNVCYLNYVGWHVQKIKQGENIFNCGCYLQKMHNTSYVHMWYWFCEMKPFSSVYIYIIDAWNCIRIIDYIIIESTVHDSFFMVYFSSIFARQSFLNFLHFCTTDSSHFARTFSNSTQKNNVSFKKIFHFLYFSRFHTFKGTIT